MSDPYAPGGSEWAKLITASKVPIVLNLDTYCSARVLFHRMTGVKPWPSVEGKPAIAHGHRWEAGALSEYETEEGVIALPAKFVRHVTIPWLAATADGIVEERTTLQIKCPYSGVIPDEVPPKYHAQVQTELEVNAMEVGHLYYYVPASPPRTKLFVIPREREWWGDTYPKLQRFYNAVQTGVWIK